MADDLHRRVAALHAAVDRAVAALVARLPGRLACGRGCTDCCRDGLTVFAVEADLIRHHHEDLLAHGAPHAPGACAFLAGDGACRIYAHRPYVCRTQGLPLRWREDDAGVEHRDICPLNLEPLGRTPTDLPAEQCWELGPWEGRLATLQAEAQGHPPPGRLRRVPLRGLFRGERDAEATDLS